MSKFSVGDKVLLIGHGSPIMVVEQIKETSLVCIWFDAYGCFHRETIIEERVLKAVNESWKLHCSVEEGVKNILKTNEDNLNGQY